MTTSHSPARTRLSLLCACALAALAGACKAEPPLTTGAVGTSDYRARHPIVLTDGARSLDVFPTGPGHSTRAKPTTWMPSCSNTGATAGAGC